MNEKMRMGFGLDSIEEKENEKNECVVQCC